jgi:hypothetical protein
MTWTKQLLILSILSIACVVPAFAWEAGYYNLRANINALGSDLYRITVSVRTNSHYSARFEVRQVSDEGDTIVLKPAFIFNGSPAWTDTPWGYSADIDVSAPEPIERIVIRNGTEDVLLPLRAHNPNSDLLNDAILHGNLIDFDYGAEKIVARPQHIYRVAGDPHGRIVLCAMMTPGGKATTRSFYILQMRDLRIHPGSTPVRMTRANEFATASSR